MKYDVPFLPRETFGTVHTMVQAAFDQGRQRFHPTLMTVSTDYADFPTVHQTYLQKCDSLGVTMTDKGKTKDEFHIWLTPSYRAVNFKSLMTVAHELTHGYVGLTYAHGAQWRRWFYRVMYHLVTSDILPMPEDRLPIVLTAVEGSYTRNHYNMYTTVHEALWAAEKEHDQVMDNYWDRTLSCLV